MILPILNSNQIVSFKWSSFSPFSKSGLTDFNFPRYTALTKMNRKKNQFRDQEKTIICNVSQFHRSFSTLLEPRQPTLKRSLLFCGFHIGFGKSLFDSNSTITKEKTVQKSPLTLTNLSIVSHKLFPFILTRTAFFYIFLCLWYLLFPLPVAPQAIQACAMLIIFLFNS